MNKPYQAYAAAMQTMANTRQVVMLYDGILRYLTRAAEAMKITDITERYQNLTRASEIVFGLQGCLDFERGGDVAKILYNFYASADARIFALHRSNDAAACEQLIAEFRQMRDAWDEIDKAAAGGATNASPASEADSLPAASVPPAPDASGGVAISA